MTHLDDKLQQYYDGELPTGETEAVQQEISSSDESKKSIQQLQNLSKAMHDSASDWAEQVDSGALFAAIKQRIDAPQAKPTLKMIRGGGQPGARRGIAVGLAAAAALCLAILAWPTSQPGLAPPLPVPVQVASSRGTEVIEVDFGDNTGTVFAVEGSIGQPLAVVWISEEEVGLP